MDFADFILRAVQIHVSPDRSGIVFDPFENRFCDNLAFEVGGTLVYTGVRHHKDIGIGHIDFTIERQRVPDVT